MCSLVLCINYIYIIKSALSTDLPIMISNSKFWYDVTLISKAFFTFLILTLHLKVTILFQMEERTLNNDLHVVRLKPLLLTLLLLLFLFYVCEWKWIKWPENSNCTVCLVYSFEYFFFLFTICLICWATQIVCRQPTDHS